MMMYFIRRWIKRMIVEGHSDELILEITLISQEVWSEDNVFTTWSYLRDHLRNAVKYAYQFNGKLD